MGNTEEICGQPSPFEDSQVLQKCLFQQQVVDERDKEKMFLAICQQYDDSLMPHARKLLQYDRSRLEKLLADTSHCSKQHPPTHIHLKDNLVHETDVRDNPECSPFLPKTIKIMMLKDRVEQLLQCQLKKGKKYDLASATKRQKTSLQNRPKIFNSLKTESNELKMSQKDEKQTY